MSHFFLSLLNQPILTYQTKLLNVWFDFQFSHWKQKFYIDIKQKREGLWVLYLSAVENVWGPELNPKVLSLIYLLESQKLVSFVFQVKGQCDGILKYNPMKNKQYIHLGWDTLCLF